MKKWKTESPLVLDQHPVPPINLEPFVPHRNQPRCRVCFVTQDDSVSAVSCENADNPGTGRYVLRVLVAHQSAKCWLSTIFVVPESIITLSSRKALSLKQAQMAQRQKKPQPQYLDKVQCLVDGWEAM